MLLRKVDNLINQKGLSDEKAEDKKAGYLDLVRESPFSDQLSFYVGHLFAFLCGAAIPTLQIFFAASFDAFQSPDRDE